MRIWSVSCRWRRRRPQKTKLTVTVVSLSSWYQRLCFLWALCLCRRLSSWRMSAPPPWGSIWSGSGSGTGREHSAGNVTAVVRFPARVSGPESRPDQSPHSALSVAEMHTCAGTVPWVWVSGLQPGLEQTSIWSGPLMLQSAAELTVAVLPQAQTVLYCVWPQTEPAAAAVALSRCVS